MALLLIAREWRPRTLLRAQLIDQGFDVLAVGGWDEGELLLQARAVRDAAVVFDLDGEPSPAASLRTLVRLVPPARVLVLTSLAALPPDEVRGMGIAHVLPRPFSVRDVIERTARMMGPGSGRAAGAGPDEALP
jgi:DNA-binding response OmpR family regulator